LKNKTNHFFKNSLLSPNVLNDLLNGVIFLALSLAEVCFVVVRGLMIVVVWPWAVRVGDQKWSVALRVKNINSGIVIHADAWKRGLCSWLSAYKKAEAVVVWWARIERWGTKCPPSRTGVRIGSERHERGLWSLAKCGHSYCL